MTGRAGRRGFLQRLAVDPAREGHGLGRALVLDGLVWLRRRGVERVVVNTQEANQRALALYEQLGFRRQHAGLAVLRTQLVRRSPRRARGRLRPAVASLPVAAQDDGDDPRRIPPRAEHLVVVEQTPWVVPGGAFALRLRVDDAPAGAQAAHGRCTGRSATRIGLRPLPRRSTACAAR